MKSHAGVVIGAVLSAVMCGATFLFALYRQFALVEVAASITTGVQLYLLSSSIGDWIERKPQANFSRLLIAGGLAVAVVLYFLATRFWEATRK
jgi:hypothetical protein